MRQVVEEFLQVQTKGLPGQVSVIIGAIDPSNNLAPCPVLEPALAAGSRAWGKTTVAVRCRAEAGWSLYVPVQIKVSGDHVVTAKPLAQGQVVSADDLVTMSGDLAELPAGIITDPVQAVGRTLAIGIPAGRPLRSDMLRQVLVVQQGQMVKVLSRGVGFRVAAEGRALNSAADGQVAQARTPTGQTLSGIARSGGIIEISY